MTGRTWGASRVLARGCWIVLCSTAACTATDDTNGRTKGRPVAVKPSAVAPALTFEPIAELQDEQGEPIDMLSRQLIVLLSDGSVVTAHPSEHVVRRYDSTGTLRATLGRKGDGPGEFRGIAALLALPHDSIAILDGMTRRITYLVNDTLHDAPSSSRGLGSMVEGRFVQPIGRFADGRWVGVTQPSVAWNERGERVIVDTPFIAAGRADSGTRRLLTLPMRPAITVSRENNSGVMSLSPLAPRVVAVCDSGLIIVDTLGVRVYDTEGAERSGMPLPIARRAVREARWEVAMWRRVLVDETHLPVSAVNRALLGRWFDAVDSIMDTPRVDATGAVWFSRLMLDTVRSVAFDVRGTPLVTVQARYPVIASRGRYIVSAVWDTLLETERYTLRRSSAGQPTARPAGLGACNAGFSI